MSTDEALEISRKIEEEAMGEEGEKYPTGVQATLGTDNTLPTVEALQTPSKEGEVYEEIKGESESSGVVSFHPKHEQKIKEFKQKESEESKPHKGIRVPFSSAADREQMYTVGRVAPLTYGQGPDFDEIIAEGDRFIEETYSKIDKM